MNSGLAEILYLSDFFFSFFTSWLTVKDTLKTHQVATVILPTTSGEILKIGKGVNAEPEHLEIYKSLKIFSEVMKPVKTWHSSNIVTERTRKLPSTPHFFLEMRK